MESTHNGPLTAGTVAEGGNDWVTRQRPAPVDDFLDMEDPVVAALVDQADNLSSIIPVTRLNFPRIKVPKVEQVGDKWRPVKDEGGLPVLEQFSIRIRALQRRERLQCERLARDESPQRGLRRNITDREVDVNEAELRMLYTATVREDRDRFWDSAALRRRYQVGEGWELIGKMLTDTEQITAILALYDLGSEAQVEQREILEK
jgi:hypothetical protein